MLKIVKILGWGFIEVITFIFSVRAFEKLNTIFGESPHWQEITPQWMFQLAKIWDIKMETLAGVGIMFILFGCFVGIMIIGSLVFWLVIFPNKYQRRRMYHA